jgi:hypothetical protein
LVLVALVADETVGLEWDGKAGGNKKRRWAGTLLNGLSLDPKEAMDARDEQAAEGVGYI